MSATMAKGNDGKCLSVIIPTFNMANTLPRCLNSLLIDKLKNIEIIVVNDGSTDSTNEILNKYKNSDSRIKIITQENQGRGAARNAGLSIAKGDYIYLIDSDDYIQKDSLYYLYKKSKNKHLDVCFIYPPRIRYRPIRYISCSPCWSYSFKKSLLEYPFQIRQPDIFSGEDGIFSNLLFTRTKRTGISFRSNYNYCKRADSTSNFLNTNPHMLTDIVKQHIIYLRNQYNQNDLWDENAVRYYLFIQDETFFYRFINRLKYLSFDQINNIYLQIKYELVHLHAQVSPAERILFRKLFLDVLYLSLNKYIIKYNLKHHIDSL